MNINNFTTSSSQPISHLLSGDSPISDTLSKENLVSSGSYSIPDGNSLLHSLSQGDIFRATILDIRNQDVTLLLSNSSQVLARMPEALSLNIGEQIHFQVKSNNENGVFIRPVLTPEISDELVQKSLAAASLSGTDKNQLIVRQLIANNQPIDRSSILTIGRLLTEFPNENIDKLITMEKHHIPVTPENLEQFDKYASSTHHISIGMEQLESDFVTLLEQLGDEKPDAFVTVLREFMDTIKEQTDPEQNPLKQDVWPVTSQETTAQTQASQDANAQTQTLQDANAQTQASQEPSTPAIQEPNVQNQSAHEVNVHTATAQEANAQTQAAHDSVTKNAEMENLQTLRAHDTQPAQENSMHIMNELLTSLEHMNASGSDAIKQSELIRNTPVAKHIRQILQSFTSLALTQQAELANLNGENLAKTLNNVMRMTKFFQHVSEELSNLSQTESQNGNHSSMQDHAKDLQNNLLFMQQLQEFTNYVQIPYRTNHSCESGDLYVYSRKNGKNLNKDTVNAFLHLDMESLGATDISVAMKATSITAKFTFEDLESQRIVEEHLSELQKRLELKGYHSTLTSEYLNRKTDSQKESHHDGALGPAFTQDIHSPNIKRYTFDMRT